MGQYNFDEIIDRHGTNAENLEGWRPYIFHCGPDRQFKFADDDFIRMWVADMEFAVAPEIRRAILDRVDRKILGYTSIYDEAYYEAFEAWCRDRYQMRFDRAELTFSPGVIPALYQITEDLVQAGEKVMTLTPAYGFFKRAAVYNQVEMVTCPLQRDGEAGDYAVDMEAFAAIAADPKMRLVYLCNPHNPTGRVWQPAELRAMADVIRERDLWVVSDEIHCDLTRTGVQHTPLANVMPDYPKLITCMSASKSFNMAGMMLSHILIRDPQERRRFRRRDKTAGAVNPLSIEAHKAAYTQGGPWLRELQGYLDGNFELVENFLREQLPEAIFHIPQATYFAWIDLHRVLPEVRDLPLFFANEAGVLLEGGDSMFVDNAGGCIRLNLAMPRVLVAEGLSRIAGAIRRR